MRKSGSTTSHICVEAFRCYLRVFESEEYSDSLENPEQARELQKLKQTEYIVKLREGMVVGERKGKEVKGSSQHSVACSVW